MNDDWVKERLHEWAQWAGHADAMGYPSSTIEYRLMREGAGAGRKGGKGGICVPEDMPRTVEETEAAVVKLPRNQREVVTHKYLKPGTDKQKAKDCGLSFDQFRRTLEASHSRIAGYLDGMQQVS